MAAVPVETMSNCVSKGAKRPSSHSAADGKRTKARNDASASISSSNDYFALADFIAPEVVRYLGVRSLVRFGSTCKSHHENIVPKEVTRRKERIAEIEGEAKRLIGAVESVPLRFNVLKAKKLSDEALRLIDDEINFHKKICTKELRPFDEYWDDEDEYDWREFDFFLGERKKFLFDYNGLGSLYILSDCFYFPPEGEASSPSQEEMEKASRKAGWIWGAEDHMGSVFECST